MKKLNLKFNVGGDYIIPVWRDEISVFPAGADLTLRLHGEINQISSRQRGIVFTWYLFRFAYTLDNFPSWAFVQLQLRWADVITWEHFVSPKQDSLKTREGSRLAGQNFPHVIV